MSNRSSVDVRYQMAEVLITLEESHFQAAEMLKKLSQEAM
jgi:hypothetical protein